MQLLKSRWIFIFLLYHTYAHNFSSSCSSQETCHECVQRPTCAWCSAEHVDVPRCFQPNFALSYINENCNEEFVYYPVGSINIGGNSELLSAKQLLTPKRINLQLKVGEPLYFSVFVDTIQNNTGYTVQLNHNSQEYVNVEFRSGCLKHDELVTNTCNNVSQRVTFNVKVDARECPKNEKEWHQQFKIYPTHIDEFVQVDVDLICSCPCERPGNVGYKLKANECYAVGTLKCGVCDCDTAHYGRMCECSVQKLSPDLGCTPPNATDNMICSGRGQCVCDKCICNLEQNVRNRITGTYCECDNFSCARYNGKICGGNGLCNCGKCSCKSRWKGDACECYNSTTMCFPPFKIDAKICSGHGECECGKCKCHDTDEGKYTGRFCEKCVSCTNACNKVKPCVLCQLYGKGPYNETECSEKCSMAAIIIVDVVEVNEQENEFLCKGQDENGCVYLFSHKQESDKIHIKAKKEIQCL